MQRDLLCFCVQIDQKLWSFKLLWFVQSPFGNGCKQVRFRASKNLSSELRALATWSYAEESAQFFIKSTADRKKPCWQTRNNLSKCKRYKSKQYKQPGEVEHSSCISSRNSPEKQNMDKPEDFVLRERLVDEKG